MASVDLARAPRHRCPLRAPAAPLALSSSRSCSRSSGSDSTTMHVAFPRFERSAPASRSTCVTSAALRDCIGLMRHPRSAPERNPRSRSSSVVITYTGTCRVRGSCLRRSSTRQPLMSGSEISSVMALGWYCVGEAQRRGPEAGNDRLEPVVMRGVGDHARERQIVLDHQQHAVARADRRGGRHLPRRRRMGAPTASTGDRLEQQAAAIAIDTTVVADA